MNLALFYDTETQGLPMFKAPSDHPGQPHIVQLAACLVDLDTRATVQSMDVIIKPEGWVIPDEVAAIHGITTEKALDVGISENLALTLFLNLWQSRPRIAHNESFDARIIRIAIKRYANDCEENWHIGDTQCTMALSSPICQLPPTEKMKAAGRNHHKAPNLSEAYKHFTGTDLKNAHSAMADVQACIAVYFAIQDGKA